VLEGKNSDAQVASSNPKEDKCEQISKYSMNYMIFL